MIDDIKIRMATVDDAENLLNIYAPYVLNTAVSFEYEVPALADFKHRISKTLESYPYLVAEQNGKILGYAYAARYYERKACDFSVEASIYVKSDCRKSGIGRMLYSELEKRLINMGIVSMYARIARAEHDDEYVNSDSIEFHKKMGFSFAGELHMCGYKFGRWYSLVCMEKQFTQSCRAHKEI